MKNKFADQAPFAPKEKTARPITKRWWFYVLIAVVVIAAASAAVAASAAAPAEENDEDNDYPQNTIVVAAVAEHIYIPFPVPELCLCRRHGARHSRQIMIKPRAVFCIAHAIICSPAGWCYDELRAMPIPI